MPCGWSYAAVATALPDMDDVMDDLQKELFRAIFAGFAGPVDEAALQMAVQLAFVGRDYERAADHAVAFDGQIASLQIAETDNVRSDIRRPWIVRPPEAIFGKRQRIVTVVRKGDRD